MAAAAACGVAPLRGRPETRLPHDARQRRPSTCAARRCAAAVSKLCQGACISNPMKIDTLIITHNHCQMHVQCNSF